jgi:dUTP pyrophosphatase
MNKIELPFTVKSDELLPKFAYEGDAGCDLRADLKGTFLSDTNSVTIEPMESMTINTGFSAAIPEGWFGMVVPRSGIACNHGVTVINTPGIVDSGYRGEIKVGLINLGSEPYDIIHGDRIAQMVLVPCADVSFMRVSSLDETERGTGGFGSSGVK